MSQGKLGKNAVKLDQTENNWVKLGKNDTADGIRHLIGWKRIDSQWQTVSVQSKEESREAMLEKRPLRSDWLMTRRRPIRAAPSDVIVSHPRGIKAKGRRRGWRRVVGGSEFASALIG